VAASLVANPVSIAPPVPRTLEEFQRMTREKLALLRCPLHHRSPEIEITGSDLRDVRVAIRSCCKHLADLANRSIAS
jgi:hypothetical protein